MSYSSALIASASILSFYKGFQQLGHLSMPRSTKNHGSFLSRVGGVVRHNLPQLLRASLHFGTGILSGAYVINMSMTQMEGFFKPEQNLERLPKEDQTRALAPQPAGIVSKIMNWVSQNPLKTTMTLAASAAGLKVYYNHRRAHANILQEAAKKFAAVSVTALTSTLPTLEGNNGVPLTVGDSFLFPPHRVGQPVPPTLFQKYLAGSQVTATSVTRDQFISSIIGKLQKSSTGNIVIYSEQGGAEYTVDQLLEDWQVKENDRDKARRVLVPLGDTSWIPQALLSDTKPQDWIAELQKTCTKRIEVQKTRLKGPRFALFNVRRLLSPQLIKSTPVAVHSYVQVAGEQVHLYEHLRSIGVVEGDLDMAYRQVTQSTYPGHSLSYDQTYDKVPSEVEKVYVMV